MARDPEIPRWKRLFGKISELPKFPTLESEIRAWDPLTNPAGSLMLDGISVQMEVLGQLKSGKEATVWCCRATSESGVLLVAAKRFVELEQRQFRNDAVYQAGRHVRDNRGGRAMRGKSGYGREIQFASWLEWEFEALHRLHSAGADVPRPLGKSGATLVMEYIGDEGFPAPLLNRANLAPHEIRPAFDRILGNIRLFLSRDCVHADLSAFNIMWWQGVPIVIDFPQSVDPRVNENAFSLLVRDMNNVCGYFRKYGIVENGQSLATELWEKYSQGRLYGSGVFMD